MSPVLDESVYRSAMVPVTVLIPAGAQLGATRAALDHVTAHAAKRGSTHTTFPLQRDSAGFQMQVLLARARVRMNTALAARYCRDAVELLVAAHGTSSFGDWNRLQRLWRDVHVSSHHAITEWQVNLEVYGKALLGVEPNITHLIQGIRTEPMTAKQSAQCLGT